MTKRVRRVSDLPDWFVLAKYAGAALLDAEGWYEQFLMRTCLLDTVTSRPANWGAENHHEVLASVRAKPIVDMWEDIPLRKFGWGGELEEPLQEPTVRHPRNSSGVHLATVRELYMTEGNIAKEKRFYAHNVFAPRSDDEGPQEPPKDNCADWIDEPVDCISHWKSFEVNVRVNMLLPDNWLIEQFKRLLQSLRAARQEADLIVPVWRKPDFSSWIRFGVLPYIDLRIWAFEAKATIPNRVMADAIFPPGEGGEEVVRKTTAKLAGELLRWEHLETLATMVAHEIAERNTA